MCAITLKKKNFKKLRVRFFLRLRNRGFKKYTLTKLFSKVTYAQRNELLKKETPPSNAITSVTLQEAEMRLHLDGERILRASQGEAEAVAMLDPMAHTLNSTTNRNTANISRHSRILSPEGWNLVFSPPRLCTFKKSLQLIANIFFKMHLCLFRKSR